MEKFENPSSPDDLEKRLYELLARIKEAVAEHPDNKELSNLFYQAQEHALTGRMPRANMMAVYEGMLKRNLEPTSEASTPISHPEAGSKWEPSKENVNYEKLQHKSDICTGRWRSEAGRKIKCDKCGAELDNTPENRLRAIDENDIGDYAKKITKAGQAYLND